MLHAVQASDTVELTLDLSSRRPDFAAASRPSAPEIQGDFAHAPHMQNLMVAAPLSQMQMAALQMQVSREHAMSYQDPASAPQMHMIHAPPIQMQTQMQTCPVSTPLNGDQVFFHSGPPKIFV